MEQLVTIRLNQLSCIAESDASGGSEPYLWVTYFLVDGRNLGAPEPVSTVTPIFDAFRKEFPDNVRAGQVMTVPPFLANFSAPIDPGPFDLMMAGCIVLLLEEDETPDKAIRAGRNAFASSIHEELNKLIRARIQTMDRGAVTPEEIKAIREAVEPKIKSAIRSNLTLFQKLFGNQDDLVNFAHVNFINAELSTKDFEFPEIADSDGKNRYVLSGRLTVGPVPPPPVDPCGSFRAAVKAKRDEIRGLQLQRESLQLQLQTASPQAKPSLIKMITELGAEIAQAEEELKFREAALKTCETGLDPTIHR